MSGVVQGVGFRWATRERARALGVTGSARNRPDGTVEVEAEGDADAVETLVAWLHTGPPSAAVSAVEVRDVAVTGATSFEVG